jgi:hypothetical protein
LLSTVERIHSRVEREFRKSLGIEPISMILHLMVGQSMRTHL